MALNIDTLAGLMKSEIEGCFGPADDQERLECFCNALSKAIIDHVKAAAEVQPGSFSNSGGAVTGVGTIT